MQSHDLNRIRRLSMVPRWCVVPTIRQQSVAEHVFQATRTAMWLYDLYWPLTDRGPSTKLALIDHVLSHDDDEAVTGDMPSPVKGRKNPKELSQIELMAKCADYLEAIAFLQEERNMGNQFGIGVLMADLVDRLDSYWLLLKIDVEKPQVEKLVTDFLRASVRPNNHPAMAEGQF